ncbi:ParB/RepB/Spo0J family partition protein, partial [bacterium]
VTGERRLRASKIAGLETIPAIVRALDDQAVIEITFIENMQREQLDEIEKAEAYGRVLSESPSSLETVAQRIGKDAQTIERRLWALNLPGVVKKAISAKVISPDQARLIAAVKGKNKQIELLEKISRLNAKFGAAAETGSEADSGSENSESNKLEIFISLIRELMAVLRSSGIKARVSEDFRGDSLDIKLSFKIDETNDFREEEPGE